MIKKGLYFVTVLMLMLGTSAFASEFKSIGADDLKKMMDEKKQLVLIDSRTEAEFAEGHIPGAKNIPPEKTNSIGSMLPKSKTIPLIFYCRGVG